MKYLEQACIPLGTRMKLADAALAYAEALVAYEHAFWWGCSVEDIATARTIVQMALETLNNEAVLTHVAFREAV